MSQSFTLACLKALGGRATVQQIRDMATNKDPLSKHAGITADLHSLRKWRIVDFSMKTKEWHITPQRDKS